MKAGVSCFNCLLGEVWCFDFFGGGGGVPLCLAPSLFPPSGFYVLALVSYTLCFCLLSRQIRACFIPPAWQQLHLLTAFPHTYALSSSLLSHPTVTFISLYSSPFYHNVCVKHLQLCQGRLWKNGDKKWDRDILETHRSRGRVSPTPLVPSMLWSLPRGPRQDDQYLYSMAKLFSVYLLISILV